MYQTPFWIFQRTKKAHTTHHRKKNVFGETFLASKKNFPGRWWRIPKTLWKTQENHIHHRNLSSVGPIFFGKEKFCTQSGAKEPPQKGVSMIRAISGKYPLEKLLYKKCPKNRGNLAFLWKTPFCGYPCWSSSSIRRLSESSGNFRRCSRCFFRVCPFSGCAFFKERFFFEKRAVCKSYPEDPPPVLFLVGCCFAPPSGWNIESGFGQF